MGQPIDLVGALLVFGLLWAAGGCGPQGPYTIHTSIEMPAFSPQKMDEVVAGPAARQLFRATGGIRDVTSISVAGKVDLFATSDGVMKQKEFVDAMRGSIADLPDTVPRHAVVGPVELLPPGRPVPDPQVRGVDKIDIEFDRAKVIDAGLSEEDIQKAIAKEREQEAEDALSPAAQAATEAAVTRKIDLLNATTLPSRDKPLTLKDVALVHVVSVPDCIVRHWP